MDLETRREGLKCAAIVVAGGSGLRMGSNIPKQFLKIAGKPIMWWTLRKLSESGLFEEIVLVLPQGWLSRAEELLDGLALGARVAEGGPRRQISVLNGLMQTDDDVDIVLVHDAVRPFVRRKTLSDVIDAAARFGAATAAMPAKETIGVSNDGEVLNEVPERSRLWHVQTPQAFRRDILLEAHKEGLEATTYATDDCQLVMRRGIRPAIVHGSEDNLKITSPMDMMIAEQIALRRENEDE
ncbi:MAG TPA: 2-C-methyl-D-erythritol 4-phosphate cytidylyltransferase [Bacillota bacterium]|nr:2-C-methyl-D-erythritol 4-phosphate cytidylyltransferase [Bacillota bacterium]HOH09637.1 2-C-methyl-D-erythritol 4-phosphate cytidylyltransferase [Bacillota bacterium]HOS50348.1 2-C-methyl-D-erythritol 4-phosphate cytidylyltransferase [Bacillota bacterium]HOY88862.1 2-C-methyl-D-erythritol 4-phosphate cytidylyltransferase [Bacillota bacterium]HPI00524.1 2-C-methyl-D-erythritol 4-phosphate cytidylyltransferase [Bacillota bacterium]